MQTHCIMGWNGIMTVIVVYGCPIWLKNEALNALKKQAIKQFFWVKKQGMVNKVTKQQAVWVFLFFSAGQNDDVFGQIALFQALF